MTDLLGGPVRTEKRWDELVGPPLSNILPFDHNPPDAADLMVNLMDEPDQRSGVPKASCRSGKDTVRIFVAVHGRDAKPLAKDGVTVTVLRTPFNGTPDLSGVPALPANWATSLKADMTARTTGAWLNGSAWAYIDPGKPFRQPARAIDAGRGEVVTWDVKLPAPAGDAMWLLLAVVHATTDQLKDTAPTDVATLVCTDHHVAARSVWIFD